MSFSSHFFVIASGFCIKSAWQSIFFIKILSYCGLAQTEVSLILTKTTLFRLLQSLNITRFPVIARFCASKIVAIYFLLCECGLPRICFATLADSRNEKNVFFLKNTHPLAPSAREGGISIILCVF
ncbi:hypothetical protein [Helicobacter sp. T3_23-1056]